MPGPGVINTRKNYYYLFNGMICQRVDEGTPNAVSRTIQKGENAGKTVWELQFNYIEGYFVDIRIGTNKMDKPIWIYVLEYEGIEYLIQVGYSSPAARSMFSRLRNIDFNKMVMLRSSIVTGDDDTDRIYLTPWYDQETRIPQYYTEDNRDEIPQWEKTTIRGEEVWDDTAQLEFMKKEVEEIIIPKMRDAHPLSEAAVNESQDEEEENPFGEEAPPQENEDDPGPDDVPPEQEEDDLPF